MTADTKANLLTRANQVRTETAGFANTASRLGGILRDIIDSLFGASELSVSSYGAFPSNTGPQNDAAIAAAVAAASANNAALFWPYGAYTTTVSIAGLHSVRHRGPGRIVRGTDTFYPDPNPTQANTLYVSASGSALNDGLTSAQPMTLSQVIAALSNYGPVLEGTWKVRGAAGTYGGGISAVGLQSRNRIEFYGPDVGGHPNVPTMIVSGSISGTNGIYFQRRMDCYFQDIKFINFTSGYGLILDGQCDLVTKNIHATNCFDGVAVEQLSEMRFEGGIIDGCAEGIRGYSQCSLSVGYNGAHASNRPIIRNCTTYGIIARDSSRLHADFIDFTSNTNIAFYLEKNTRGVANDCNFTTNNIAVRCELGCAYGESTPSTFSGNTQNYVLYSTVDETSNHLTYFDRGTGFYLYGASSYATPPRKFSWTTGTSLLGITYNTNVRYVFEMEGAGSNYIGLGVANNGSAGILVANPAGAAQGFFYYDTQNNRWRMAVNGTERFHWDAGIGFIALDDNSRALGDSTHRWKESYVVARRWSLTVFDSFGTGSPNGAVTADIGSTFRRTDGGAGTSFYVKESGNGTNTGWVAK